MIKVALVSTTSRQETSLAWRRTHVGRYSTCTGKTAGGTRLTFHGAHRRREGGVQRSRGVVPVVPAIAFVTPRCHDTATVTVIVASRRGGSSGGHGSTGERELETVADHKSPLMELDRIGRPRLRPTTRVTARVTANSRRCLTEIKTGANYVLFSSCPVFFFVFYCFFFFSS